MDNSDEIFETSSSISTTTVKTSRRIGAWGGMSSMSDHRRHKILEDTDPWSSSFLGWDEERGRPDGEKISFERSRASSSRSKRLSDLSTASGNDHDADAASMSSTQSGGKMKHPVEYSKRSIDHARPRRAINFFRDDFDVTMERMIRDFDSRCSRSLWDDEDDDDFFSRDRRRGDDDFFSRSRLSNRSHFGRSRVLPSVFDSRLEDFWPERKSIFDDDYAESGIFSDRGSSQLSHRTDDSEKIDKTLQQERKITPEKFEVDINVQGYKANELLVKTEGRRLVICAKTRNEERDANKLSREFKREFDLPEGVNPYDVTSNLMPDGYLRVEAPVRRRMSELNLQRLPSHFTDSSNDVPTRDVSATFSPEELADGS